jgi:CheY-like chemotaxis protein
VAVLRRQQALGLAQDAQATLEKIDQELQGLRQELDGSAEQAKSGPPKPHRAKALVVEDDHNERELLAGFLRMAGIDVDAVEDGLDALDYLRGHDRPDVVLLDLGLPRCDGPTMVREIRRDPAYAGLKIFAVTGRRQDEFGGNPAGIGIDRWFPKPLNPEALLEDLNREFANVG